MTPLSSSDRPRPGDRSVWSAAFALTALAGTAGMAAAVIDSGPPRVSVAVLALLAAVLVLVLLTNLRRRQRADWATFASGERDAQRRILGYQQQLAEREREAERQALHFQQRLAEQETQWRDRLEAGTAAVNEALEHLLRIRLPAVSAGTPVPPAPNDETLDDGTAGLLDEVLAEATSALKRADEREESLRLAVVALSRRVQTAAHSIQEHVSLMAERHQHDPDVVESSMRVDHAAAQQARHAQSLAVLCGEWPGQQWQEPLAMVDVVRAASARILAYQRVEVSGDQDVAVAAEVVEPVIHLVAELLANATQSSPPATVVPVTVRRVQRGAVIEIDDGGVGMDEHRLEQARETVSGRRHVGLGELGEIPQTGLAVVGHYVRRHGFRADLSESPYGGLRAVVLIPAKAVETVEPPEAVVNRPPEGVRTDPVERVERAERVEPVATVENVPSDPQSPSETTLPRRRSRRGQAVAAVSDEPAASPAATPEQAGSWMGAFIEGGRTGGDPAPEGSS